MQTINKKRLLILFPVLLIALSYLSFGIWFVVRFLPFDLNLNWLTILLGIFLCILVVIVLIVASLSIVALVLAINGILDWLKDHNK